MPIRLGTDIVHIPRIVALLSNPTALSRIFTPAELKDKDPAHLAGILAAKEAVFKALDSSPRWHDVEVLSSPSGKPTARISLEGKDVEGLEISISHDGDYAVAMAIIIRS